MGHMQTLETQIRRQNAASDQCLNYLLTKCSNKIQIEIILIKEHLTTLNTEVDWSN